VNGRSATDLKLLMPWVESPGHRVRRVLASDPGQNWGSWAVVEDGVLVGSGNHVIEHGGTAPCELPQYLPRLDPNLLSPEERSHAVGPQFDRRLYGIRAALADEMERQAPIDVVAVYDYGQSRGQYTGIVKSLCFERGLEITTVGWPEVGQCLLADREATYEQIEAEAKSRYSDMPCETVLYDDGSPHEANPASSIGLALAAWRDLQRQGRT